MPKLTQSENSVSIIFCTVSVLVNIFIMYLMAVLSINTQDEQHIQWALIPAMAIMLCLTGICANESVILNRVLRMLSFILTYWGMAQLATMI